ncbi:MAG: hypothetical protein ACYCOU_11665 [Sulfobacillus sp.]
MAKEVVEDRAPALRSLLMIAIVTASIGIIVGAMKPSEVLKCGGCIVAAVIAAIVIFTLLIHLWFGLVLSQPMLFVAAGTGLWLWRNRKHTTRKGAKS